jgi:hypothetical protein
MTTYVPFHRPDDVIGYYYEDAPHCAYCASEYEGEGSYRSITYRDYQLAESPEDQRCADCGVDLS